MEMEAAAPRAKKRRSEAPDSQEREKSPAPASSAAEAPDPKSATKSEESPSQEPPPPGAGGEEGGGSVDQISGLPDAILGDIVSLLPTKEAGRTHILASRWRHIWRSAPLNIDCRGLPADDEVVSRILSVHPGPGRRLCVPAHHIHDRPATVDAWLRSSALDNLQEIDFFHTVFQPVVQQLSPPPASIFRFSLSLHLAIIGKCHISDGLTRTLHFPQLKQFALEKVHISEGSLHSLISSCPALQCLLLMDSFGFPCFRINSNSLISVGVRAQCYNPELRSRELIVEDAPCLEKLLYVEAIGLHVSVISAPKLETLGCPSDSHGRSRLVFGSTTFQGLHIVSLTAVVRNVKILAVNMRVFNLDKVIDLMKCFPCLEKLYMKSCHSGLDNRWRRKHKQLIKCLDIRLKTVVLENYRGINAQINFASFVLNARELEVMRLEVENSNYNEWFFPQQHRMLQMENMASRVARLDFTTHRCHHDLLPIKHVHDLSITDPFECRC